jgi:acyl-CoA reductase-like NAD-dependent aldehyde dehydrogenase
MVNVTGNLVDGVIDPHGDLGTIEVSDPANFSRVVGAVPSMSANQVQVVMTAAERGARTWKNTSSIARGLVLQRVGQRLRDDQERLAQIITSEMGKTLTEARGEVGKAAEFFEYYAALGRLPFGELLPDARPGTYARVIHEPLGVVAMITPWNDPLLTPARKLGPALIAGNAVVIKPPTIAPLITLELADIFNEAGLPAGVLGTVTGKTSIVAEQILSHSSVAAVTFTGSTSVGRKLQRDLAGRSVRVQTEMGGKNAVAVLADADIELAASNIVVGGFAQAGQRCTAASRIVAHRDIVEDLNAAILEKMRDFRLGAGNEDQVTIGPVVSQEAQASVFEHIDRAVSEGAELLSSNNGRSKKLPGTGAFVEPTLLRVTREHSVWRQEVFGPVVSVLEVSNIDEAIDAVNDSSYGLSAAIFTQDLATAERFIAEANTGQVSVNQPTTGWDIHHPFGGFKDSGSAFKEQGTEALQFYTRTKTVAVHAS